MLGSLCCTTMESWMHEDAVMNSSSREANLKDTNSMVDLSTHQLMGAQLV
jgi:hypothetical protein